MTVFTIIGIAFVAIGTPFLVLNLAMMRRDNRRLRQHRAGTVPLEEYSPLPERQLKPHVPSQWQGSGNAQDDPREDHPRDTPPA
jgi:hypothetical protein